MEFARPIIGAGLRGFRDWLALFATRPRFLVLAAFLFAGDLKANPRLAWIPVDLTLLTAAALSAVIAWRLLRGWRTPSFLPLVLVGVWFLTFLPGAWQAADSEYGHLKVLSLFSFTLLSALAPLFLVDDEDDVPRLMAALAWFALAIALEAALVTVSPAYHPSERLEVFGAGTIALGRAAGLLFVLAFLRLAQDSALPGLTFGMAALGAVVALFSGSRGPLLAALAATLPLLALRWPRLGAGRHRAVLAAGLLAVVLGASLSLAPQGSLERVERFVHGEYGESEAFRAQALANSWDRIPDTPWGLGWAGFATRIDPLNGMGRQYPHNLLAEVTLESGWLCGLFTLVVLGAALGASWLRTRAPRGRLLFGGLVFYLVNALVSGDINDNRILLMLVALGLLQPFLREVRHA